MYNRNEGLLQKYFKEQWAYMKHFLETYENGSFHVEKAKNGMPILLYGSEALSSRYDPKREGALLVKDIEVGKHILFYGLGMGYHIEELLLKYPDITYSIYEPNPDVFYHFLQHRDLKVIQPERCKGLFLQFSPHHLDVYSSTFTKELYEQCTFFVLPSYKRSFQKELDEFTSIFRLKLRGQRDSMIATRGYALRWTENASKNFSAVLTSPSIFNYASHFYGKPAILIGAGPSLSFEIENLRRIMENQSAYLVSVGSSNKVLLQHGITPHFLTTYDPNAHNVNVYKEMNEQENPVPLVFGTTVGYETTEQYKGPLLYMPTNQDTIFPYFFPEYSSSQIIHDAPTIASVTLELLAKLGCNPIILVGQNFGFLKDAYYAEGISYPYRSTHLNVGDEQMLVEVPSVDGDMIKTIDAHTWGRQQMEVYIQELKSFGVEVVNTTKGGAKIEGATYCELENILLPAQVCNAEWYKEEVPTSKERLYATFQKLEKSKKEWKDIIKEMTTVYQQLHHMQHTLTESPLQKKLKRLDKLNKRLLKNDYQRIFFAPITRLEYDYLRKNLADTVSIQHIPTRIQRILATFGGFTGGLVNLEEKVEQLYQCVKEAVEK